MDGKEGAEKFPMKRLLIFLLSGSKLSMAVLLQEEVLTIVARGWRV